MSSSETPVTFDTLVSKPRSEIKLTDKTNESVREALSEVLEQGTLLTPEEINRLVGSISLRSAAELAYLFKQNSGQDIQVLDLIRKTQNGEQFQVREQNDQHSERESRYLLRENPLSSGGLGQIHVGFDTKLRRLVALKKLQRMSPGFIQSFRQEAETHANTEHPNVVNVYDYIEVGNNTYMVMQFMDPEESPTLGNLQKQQPTETSPTTELSDGSIVFKPDAILQSAEGIIAAINFLHERRTAENSPIFHRDIKPDNIFWTPHGVKITDFGMATTIPDLEMGSGTPPFMSPERFTTTDIDIQSEMYSLSLVLYDLISGRSGSYAQGDSPYDIAVDLMTVEPASRIQEQGYLQQYAQKFSLNYGKLELFFIDTLASEPSNRPRDLKTYRARLHEALTPQRF